MSLQNNSNGRLIGQHARILKENPFINDENRVPGENNETGAAVPRLGRNQKKREVLGELGRPSGSGLKVFLDSNVPQQRKRPLRNAKFGSVSGQDENDFQQKYKVTDYDHKFGFKIHVDNEENTDSAGDMSISKEDHVVDSKLEMHAAVTTLPKQNFERLGSTFSMDIDSPMVLETSLDQSILPESSTEIPCSVSPYDVYKNDIFQHIRESEEKNRPRPTYMNKQTDITHSMRSILVDWLVEVTEEYKLLSDTLFLAVNYIDRFLSVMAVNRGKLQLLGTACMFIASKFEEIEAPDLGEFVYITDDTYTRSQVLKMEQLILKVLSFTVAVPTATTFLDHYFHEATVDNKQFQYLAKFLLELTLLDADPYLQYKPSIIAAASFYLAAKTLGSGVLWHTELEQLTDYFVSDFQSCVKLLHVTHRAASKHAQQAIYLKYSSDKFLKVATIPPLQMKNFKVP
ncbi:G2/mitotic-specific cyclin-A-like [Argonauta hians]